MYKNTKTRLFTEPNQPYYVFTPPYQQTSGGARAMHYLCHALNLAGEEAYSHNPDVHPDLRTPMLTTAIITAHQQAGRSPIVIYPEVVSGNPMNAHNVVRYLLAPPSAYTAEPIDRQPGDLLYTYGPSLVPDGWKADLLRIPLVDSRIFNAHGVDDSQRTGQAVFFHRHLANGGQCIPETKQAIEISYRVPARSPEALAAIFRGVDCLYIYEHSTIVFEALMCGCPVIYILNTHSLPAPFPWLMDGHGISWGLESSDIAKAKATVKYVPAFYQQEEHIFWENLQGLIEKTQGLALDQHARRIHPDYVAPAAQIQTTPTTTTHLVVTPNKKKKRIIVYTVESTWSPCPQIRLLRPFAHLSGDWELIWGIVDGKLSLEAAQDADLIILHRFTPGLMPIATLASIFNLGITVVYESDDLLNAIPSDHPEAATSLSWKEGIEYAVRHAQAIVVSTVYLAEKYRSMNTTIHVLKNYLDVDMFYRPVPLKKKTDPITIGLLGSSIQPSNFALVDHALRALCDRYKERLTIHFVGWECPNGWENHPQVQFFSFIHDYVQYAHWLTEQAWDIALIPLANDDYNQCKSAVKWLDYSAAGIVSIFSDVSVYNDVVTHNKTGYLLPNNNTVWLKQITALIESPQQRQKIALAAQIEVQTDFDLKRHAAQYDQVYRGFLDLPVASMATTPVPAIETINTAPPQPNTALNNQRIPGVLLLDPGGKSDQLRASLDSLAVFLPEMIKVVVLTTGDVLTHTIGANLQCIPVKPDAYAGMLGRIQHHVAFVWLASHKVGHVFTPADIADIQRYHSVTPIHMIG